MNGIIIILYFGGSNNIFADYKVFYISQKKVVTSAVLNSFLDIHLWTDFSKNSAFGKSLLCLNQLFVEYIFYSNAKILFLVCTMSNYKMKFRHFYLFIIYIIVFLISDLLKNFFKLHFKPWLTFIWTTFSIV